MTISVEWLANQPHILHCHLGGDWTLRDLRDLMFEYQYQTANRTTPFDIILTSDSAPDRIPMDCIAFPVHPAQQAMIVVNAHRFFEQLNSVVSFAPSSSVTYFAGSWTEACHLVMA